VANFTFRAFPLCRHFGRWRHCARKNQLVRKGPRNLDRGAISPLARVTILARPGLAPKGLDWHDRGYARQDNKEDAFAGRRRGQLSGEH